LQDLLSVFTTWNSKTSFSGGKKKDKGRAGGNDLGGYKARELRGLGVGKSST
jgi:hypothetical protein